MYLPIILDLPYPTAQIHLASFNLTWDDSIMPIPYTL